MTGATAFQSAAVSGQTTQYRRQKFLSWFPRRDSFISKPDNGERWETLKAPLFDALILRAISDTHRGLFRGCFSSHRTMFAVLDIDIESRYRNESELKKLQAHLTAVDLYGISYRSSESGGWHLYLPFDKWEDSEEVETALKTWLKCLGYKIAGGQLEVFPSGNGLRLPLQKGFAWLDSDGNVKVRREEIREDEALASFIQDLEKNAQNWQQAKRLIDSQIESAGAGVAGNALEHEKVISLAGFEDFFKRGKIEEVWKNGRDYWLYGLTGKNQRHDAVMAVGHYLWYGDHSENVPAFPGRRNDETRARLIDAWLRKKHNGFCNHINRDDWKEIEAHIWRTVFWRRGKNYQARKPYPLTDRLLKRLLEVYTKTGRLYEIDRMAEANRKREQGARARIKNAFDHCLKTGQQITRNALAEKAGCSPNTVSRHQDLWFLTTGSGVYNRGVWGVSSGSAVPEVGFEEKEKSEIPLCSDLDSEDLETEQPISFTVAPLQFCPANSQPESTQHKDQALRVAAQVLTPGPLLSGIRAEGQMCAGGFSLCQRLKDLGEHSGQFGMFRNVRVNCARLVSDDHAGTVQTFSRLEIATLLGIESRIKESNPERRKDFLIHADIVMSQRDGIVNKVRQSTCYTVLVTGYGIKEKEGVALIASVLSDFGEKSKFGKIIPNAINYKFLTTGKPGYSSGETDEFSLISKRNRNTTAPNNSSSVRLVARRPTLWLRGPPV